MKALKLGLWTLWVVVSLAAVKVVYDLPLAPAAMPTVSAQQLAANRRRATSARQAAVTNVKLTDLTHVQTTAATLLQRQMVGTLQIPSQRLTLPIMSAPSDAAMMIGAAQYFPQRRMGRGNYVLASHNLTGSNLLLAHINRLRVGQRLTVSSGRQSWDYRVTTNRVVDETQVQVVANTTQPKLTLMRCEGGLGTTKRRIVQAQLQSQAKGSTRQTIAPRLTAYQRLLQRLGRWRWVRGIAAWLSQVLAGRHLIWALVVGLAWLVATILGWQWARRGKRKRVEGVWPQV